MIYSRPTSCNLGSIAEIKAMVSKKKGRAVNPALLSISIRFEAM